MHLNNLKPAWKQLKIINAIPSIESEEILSIIEQADGVNKAQSPSLLFDLAMFIFITFICQGG